MGKNSKIEWTDHTFNPWWGCVKVSPGCKNCYAETQANRFGEWWGKDNPRREFGDKHWNDPYRWNRLAEKEGRPHRVFCGSMCDIFEDNGYQIERWQLWDIIENTPNLDWLLLTKRPENITLMIPSEWYRRPPGNLLIGTSIEDQEYANRRLPKLMERVPSMMRQFLSIEPLLGPIDITDWLLDGIAHWVIVGGESGVNARPMHPFWVRDLRDQCKKANIPFFFKQWGEWAPSDWSISRVGKYSEHKIAIWPDGRTQTEWSLWDDTEGVVMKKVGKKHAGNILDGEQYLNFYPGGNYA